MYRQSEKNLLNINTFSTCPHNMVNFGPITAKNCWRVWCTPANIGIGSVTARYSSSGCQPNFAALNRGRHLYSARRPSRWALAHIFMAALRSRCGHYISALLFLSFFLLSSFFPRLYNLSGRRLDVYHTSTHGVALVRI